LKSEEDKGRKEKNRGDEPILVIIHVYMEISQGNTLYRDKNFPSSSLSLSLSLLTKNREQVLTGSWHQWEEGGYKERVQEVECGRNIVYSYVLYFTTDLKAMEPDSCGLKCLQP
jgi:hypothetical protein